MNFIHMADMHLGYRQYDLEQRFIDLGHTFRQIVEYAIAHKVEFVLISGDLFDKRSINAPTFVQAHHVLSLLKDAGIPCIAIEGNHDRRFLKDGMSWLESLEWQGLLKVVKNDNGSLMGGYVDEGKTRIFGLGFAGSLTAAAIPRIAEEIRAINEKAPPDRTILMMHAGVQGKMKYGIIGDVTYEDLYPLKGLVDYLALGHYHGAYDVDGWVYNPGCPDTCSIAEVGEPKGFYHVTGDGAKLVRQDIRKFIIVRVSADTHKTADSLREAISTELARQGKYEEPVVNIIIDGTLGFDKSHLNVDNIRDTAKEQSGALYVDVRFDLMNDEFRIARLDSNALDRTAVEREVFRKLARSDSILAGNSELFAASLTDVKDLAIKGADEHTLDSLMRKIFDEVKNSPPVIAEAPAPISVTIEKLVPEEPPKPVKRAHKKPQKAGQASLDWGEDA
jgi:DNA repair protein SbcD/Mre11